MGCIGMIGHTTGKERTIFDHTGNRIKTEDREIRILAKYEEPLVVVLGNVLSDHECDELIEHSRERLRRSKIGEDRSVNSIRTSSGVFCEQTETITRIEKRISQISVFPTKGMAVYFEYFYRNQELNEFTLHAGAQVIHGEKWVATMWMRRQSFRVS